MSYPQHIDYMIGNPDLAVMSKKGYMLSLDKTPHASLFFFLGVGLFAYVLSILSSFTPFSIISLAETTSEKLLFEFPIIRS